MTTRIQNLTVMERLKIAAILTEYAEGMDEEYANKYLALAKKVRNEVS